jgi:aspartyl-tRNA(Asn)/glutamyl-tRNA(Gln) amidotransferase subunit C
MGEDRIFRVYGLMIVERWFNNCSTIVQQLLNHRSPINQYICNMEVTDSMITKLAHLARLEFNETEKAGIRTDLQKMIAFVEKLNELDLSGVEPLLHISNEINVLRADEVKKSITRDQALMNAPDHDDRFFKVPKVLKK